MPYKDNIKEYHKNYYICNKEKIKARVKERYICNTEYIKKYAKEYRENNTEKIREHRKKYGKEYRQTEQGIKSKRISNWKHRGVSLDYDFDIIYDIYINTDVCDYCNIELIEGLYGNNKKCLDHDHNTGEIRAILCNACNNERWGT